jgi:hypothetical protein
MIAGWRNHKRKHLERVQFVTLIPSSWGVDRLPTIGLSFPDAPHQRQLYFPTASVMPTTPVVTLGALAPENGGT